MRSLSARKLTRIIIIMSFLVFTGARIARAQGDDIGLNNTFQYKKGGVYHWQVYVEADSGALSKIDYVEYLLDPSYNKPVRQARTPRSGKYPFPVSDETQEPFDITANVVFWNQPTRTLRYRLKLKPDKETAVTEELLLKQRSQVTLSQPEFQGSLTISVGNISLAGLELKILRSAGGEVRSASSGSKVSIAFRFNGKNYVLKGRTKNVFLSSDSVLFTVYRRDPG